MPKILVTGGAGFIGSHLCEKLIEQGNEVTSFDNYFTGSEKNHVPGVKYIKGETKDIEDLVKETPDMVYHLGEYSRVLTSFEDVRLVWRLNIVGTFNVLEYCRTRNIKILYAGSSTKFGDNIGGRDDSPYAWSKANNTELVNNYHKWFGLPRVITYFYNVYGGREIREGKYATLIGIFTDNYLKGKPHLVNAPGTQRRAFTHIDDIVAGLILAGEKGAGDGYCIGSEKTYSVLEVAKLFGGEIKMLPEKPGDRRMSTIDLTKIKELGWEEKHNLEDYIKSVKNANDK